MIMSLNVGPHLSWASHCQEMAPNPVQTSLFTWAMTAGCKLCGFSPACSLSVDDGDDLDAWLPDLIWSSEFSTDLEFAIMQRHSKLCVSRPPVVSRLQGWTELPDDLLHSIFSCLGSFRDLLAFAATCPSWRAAFSSYPSKSTLCTLFPPLLIQPNVLVHVPHRLSNNGHHNLRTCKVIDPANQNTSLHCQIDEETLQTMRCAGPSYGQLIFCKRGRCLVVDPFTGAQVSPPCLPFSDDYEKLTCSRIPLRLALTEYYYSAILTAPLASSNSHLLVRTCGSLFDWLVGSDSWSEVRCTGVYMEQIVEFNGQFIVMDIRQRIYTLELAPQLGLQEIMTINLPPGLADDNDGSFKTSWLAVCGDMLLMVVQVITSVEYTEDPTMVSRLHRLDMSTKPAKWVRMEKLDDWAVFVGEDFRSTPFSCMGPERWGGRSKCLYYADDSPPWSVHGLGNEPDPSDDPDLRYYTRSWCNKMQPLWVYPSMFYSVTQ
uniref:Uncharacterized protein n=1 Tax=Avena sativa TaxID=4498 RepID=A0ACD6ABG9_AVESA